MTIDTRANPTRLHRLAHQDLHAGRWKECLAKLDLITDLIGPHPAVLHMRALALQGAGHSAEALGCFDAALSLPAPQADPYLFANAARLNEALGHVDRALELHEAACRAGPRLLDLRLAHIGSARRLRGDEAADALFREWLQVDPEWGELHHHHALFLHDRGDGEAALEAIDRTVELRPNSVSALHLRARIRLELGQGDAREFEAIIALSPEDEAVYMGAAAAHVQQGCPAKALALLDAALERHPRWYQALQTRLAIGTQLVSPEVTAVWLEDFARRHKEQELGTALPALVWRAQGAAAGLAALGKVGISDKDPVTDRLMRAELLSEMGETTEAEQIFDTLGVSSHQLAPPLRMAQVRHFFRIGEIEKGTALARQIAAASQLIEAWAHVELGWRILDDSRWDWLTGSGALIEQRALYRFDDYGQRLSSALRRLHAPLRHHPSEQSARHGTQTDGRLFSLGHPAIRELVADIRSNVASYLATIPELGPEHPLTPLRGRNFRFSGSWSIRLTGSGFHAPHFHNEGLISSACYIGLPAIMSNRAANLERDGWLELGRPPASLGLSIEPFRMIKPKEGTLALFPSFFFHGTRPFGSGERMTAAFDVAPIAD